MITILRQRLGCGFHLLWSRWGHWIGSIYNLSLTCEFRKSYSDQCFRLFKCVNRLSRKIMRFFLLQQFILFFLFFKISSNHLKIYCCLTQNCLLEEDAVVGEDMTYLVVMKYIWQHNSKNKSNYGRDELCWGFWQLYTSMSVASIFYRLGFRQWIWIKDGIYHIWIAWQYHVENCIYKGIPILTGIFHQRWRNVVENEIILNIWGCCSRSPCR